MSHLCTSVVSPCFTLSSADSLLVVASYLKHQHEINRQHQSLTPDPETYSDINSPSETHHRNYIHVSYWLGVQKDGVSVFFFSRCDMCHVACIYLRVSFEVILVKRLEVALVRACGRGLASWWDKVGEVGGAEYTGGPRSLS